MREFCVQPEYLLWSIADQNDTRVLCQTTNTCCGILPIQMAREFCGDGWKHVRATSGGNFLRMLQHLVHQYKEKGPQECSQMNK